MPNIYGLIFRILNSEEAANQVAQEVFDFGWRNINQVRMNSSLLGWFQGIVITTILSMFRNNTIPKEKRETTLMLSQFDRLLRELSFAERFLLILRDMQKYSYEEIHDLMPELDVEEIQQNIYDSRKRISEGLKR
jgi:DNA-directed RNA polymerase specialized sigma24 family protein